LYTHSYAGVCTNMYTCIYAVNKKIDVSNYTLRMDEMNAQNFHAVNGKIGPLEFFQWRKYYRSLIGREEREFNDSTFHLTIF